MPDPKMDFVLVKEKQSAKEIIRPTDTIVLCTVE